MKDTYDLQIGMFCEEVMKNTNVNEINKLVLVLKELSKNVVG